MLTKHLFKVLVVSMLAVIGMMAVSASAAQAEWLILDGEKSVSSIVIEGTVEAGEMLVPDLLALDCSSGKASATVAGNGTTKLEGAGEALFSGCVVKDSEGNVNKFCTVNSPGEPAGSIKATGKGVGSMPNALDVLFLLSSINFSEILIEGALCPLDEFDDTVEGAVTLTILKGVDKEKLHVIHLDEKRDPETGDSLLTYGGNQAELHSDTQSDVLGSAVAASGNAWALALKGL